MCLCVFVSACVYVYAFAPSLWQLSKSEWLCVLLDILLPAFAQIKMDGDMNILSFSAWSEHMHSISFCDPCPFPSLSRLPPSPQRSFNGMFQHSLWGAGGLLCGSIWGAVVAGDPEKVVQHAPVQVKDGDHHQYMHDLVAVAPVVEETRPKTLRDARDVDDPAQHGQCIHREKVA